VAANVIEALMLDCGLRRGFDAAVEHQARESARQPQRQDGRRDLRELATFTIDPVGARDFDDAVSAQRMQDGTVRVWVHIADVSAYVPAGSLVDREARERGTSVYVPGAVEPMLPHALSNEACSLLPGHDRLTLTVEMTLDGAEIRASDFFRAIIRSDVRLDYERVDRIFAGVDSAQEPWAQALTAARQAAAALNDERQRRGGLTLDSPEPQFDFDQQGNVSVTGSASHATESHRLIEHLMIAANEAVAGFLQSRRVPCLYRVHERPEPRRIERLVDQLASLEVPTPPVPEHMSASQAAQLVGEISRLVERYSQREAGTDPQAPPSGRRLALTSLVLRSLQQAYYSPRNVGHAGLGSACYCHFTSPIRRYPDLVCHRALLHALGEHTDGLTEDAGGLTQLGVWTSERERGAMKIERDADDVARCLALEGLLERNGREQIFNAELIGLISAGAFAAFGESQATAEPWLALYEGMLPVRRLGAGTAPGGAGKPSARPKQHKRARSGRYPYPDQQRTAEREWWELNEYETILHGTRSGSTLRLGDPIQVRVVGVDVPRGRVELTVADG
jgi:ribonuclease R